MRIIIGSSAYFRGIISRRAHISTVNPRPSGLRVVSSRINCSLCSMFGHDAHRRAVPRGTFTAFDQYHGREYEPERPHGTERCRSPVSSVSRRVTVAPDLYAKLAVQTGSHRANPRITHCRMPFARTRTHRKQIHWERCATRVYSVHRLSMAP